MAIQSALKANSSREINRKTKIVSTMSSSYFNTHTFKFLTSCALKHFEGPNPSSSSPKREAAGLVARRRGKERRTNNRENFQLNEQNQASVLSSLVPVTQGSGQIFSSNLELKLPNDG